MYLSVQCIDSPSFDNDCLQLAVPSGSCNTCITVTSADTPVSTDTAQPSETPAPVTVTLYPVLAQGIQMMGTMLALMGPSAHLTGFVDLYSNPIGTPLESWHEIPIMKEAIAGQEFQPDVYAYKQPQQYNRQRHFIQSNPTH